MDVADKGKKIVFLVTKDRFVAVLEKVAGALVAAVVVLGIPGEELPHDSRDALFAAFENDIKLLLSKKFYESIADSIPLCYSFGTA
ncbi:MAG TPA: hypothetical protein VI584_00710 [Nitrospiria bacterium]|nr:hypothetical protein [Nitrospiria bacterium]